MYASGTLNGCRGGRPCPPTRFTVVFSVNGGRGRTPPLRTACRQSFCRAGPMCPAPWFCHCEPVFTLAWQSAFGPLVYRGLSPKVTGGLSPQRTTPPALRATSPYTGEARAATAADILRAGHMGPALQMLSDSAFFSRRATGGKKRQVDRQERLQEVRRPDRLRVIRPLQTIPVPPVCAIENFCEAVDKCKLMCYIVITDVNSGR